MKVHIALPNDRLMCGGEPNLADATGDALCQKCHQRAVSFAENYGLKAPHNALIILYADFPHGGDAHLAMVLAAVPEYDVDEQRTKWVTWQYNKQTKAFFGGHYFDTELDARRDYAKRCATICRVNAP